MERVEGVVRKIRMRDNLAARKIQAVFRGFLSRKRTEIVTLTQDFIRQQRADISSDLHNLTGGLNHLRFNLGFRVHQSATVIQKHFRGYSVRTKLRPLLAEYRAQQAALLTQRIACIQSVFRRFTAVETVKETREEIERSVALLRIRRNLAIVTIRTLLYPHVLAFRAEREKLTRRRQRRALRFKALLQVQLRSSRRSLLTPTPKEKSVYDGDTASVMSRSSRGDFWRKEPSVKGDDGEAGEHVKEETRSVLDDISSIEGEIQAVQPLGRARCRYNYSRPTTSSVEKSAFVYPSRQSPKERTSRLRNLRLASEPLTGKFSPSPKALPRSPNYLCETESWKIRADPHYEIPVVREKPMRQRSPGSGGFMKPTESWNVYAAQRRSSVIRRRKGHRMWNSSVSPQASSQGKAWHTRPIRTALDW